VTGEAKIGDTIVGVGRMAVLEPNVDVPVVMALGTKAVICGGAPMESPRKINWNFVSSDAEKIAAARADWTAAIQAGGTARFPAVPGDEDEWIPLPS